ncbi:MAG: carboxynorspermidine decarboxylase [Kiritimatiellae bacterium]|nr:carboxynorspermidine decarboxylase [Kiritimatiellia bacterium]
MPRYVVDESALRRNLEILENVARRTQARILLAQKAFSCTAAYPLCARHLAGTTASSLFEARHGHDNFGGETHVFAPAYDPDEIDEILSFVDHIVFNSPRQVALLGEQARKRGVSAGLRVNPEVSVATTPAYDPCRPSSRLGTTRAAFDVAMARDDAWLSLVEGLHFHCLCEQGLDELRKVLAGFEKRFGDLLQRMKWVNFGGGHHITRADYDADGLVALIADFRARHPHLAVYLEPGEAIALNAGTLEARILEIQPAGGDGIANAILDVSAACHMPDVLEMPYTPPVAGASKGPCGPYAYRFGGPTCLAGDEIGVYSFARPLSEGDPVVFEDMAIYTMVKNNTFNGIALPDIVLRHEDGSETLVRRFSYDDFASRL